jgi:hypothetical protein
MDKNIVALVREDVHTVNVVFPANLTAVVNLLHQQRIADAADAAGETVSDFKQNLKYRAPSLKRYTYVVPRSMQVRVSDLVLVHAGEQAQLAIVMESHADVRIEPNSETEYKWVMARVDLAQYFAEIDRNAALQAMLNDAYQRRIKRSFKDEILASLGSDVESEQLNKLLGRS